MNCKMERLMARRLLAKWASAPAVILAFVLIMGAMRPHAVVAQTGGLVMGRVVEAGTNAEINGAVVELVGYGRTLTSGGSFFFGEVSPGAQVIRVTAYGYEPETRGVVVDTLTVVDFELRVAPIAIDPLTVDVQVMEVEGRVRDAQHDFPIVDAMIFTRWGMLESDSHGRFRVESFPEGEALPLSVQAFGYMTLDTVLLPSRDSVYEFVLEEDAQVRALIDAQIERLEERIGFRWSAMLKPLNRDDLIPFAGSATMWDVLLFRYRPWLEQVKCVVLDEQVIGLRSGPIHNTLYSAQAAMRGLLPEEVERVDFFAFGGRYKGAIMRVYTRNFMRDMVDGAAELVAHPYAQDIHCT
jgi:hypothetical protein